MDIFVFQLRCMVRSHTFPAVGAAVTNKFTGAGFASLAVMRGIEFIFGDRQAHSVGQSPFDWFADKAHT